MLLSIITHSFDLFIGTLFAFYRIFNRSSRSRISTANLFSLLTSSPTAVILPIFKPTQAVNENVDDEINAQRQASITSHILYFIELLRLGVNVLLNMLELTVSNTKDVSSVDREARLKSNFFCSQVYICLLRKCRQWYTRSASLDKVEPVIEGYKSIFWGDLSEETCFIRWSHWLVWKSDHDV